MACTSAVTRAVEHPEQASMPDTMNLGRWARTPWVRTLYCGAEAVGRVLGRVATVDREALFEIELPLHTNGRMARVLRRADEFIAIEVPGI